MAVRIELIARFDDVVAGLRSAGERFDQGDYDQAVVLAAHLRELLHGDDALIGALGVADRLAWVDTAGVPNPKTQCPTACLTLMKVGNRARRGGEFVPKMNLYPPAPIRTRDGGHIDRGSRISFEHWWTNPVLRDTDGVEYSREQLVLHVAGQRNAGSGASLRASNPVAASIRQIAYEVLQSIRQQHNVIHPVQTRLAG
ncbi:hypothetical protein ACAG25_22020 [Mycobacterium sp. pV006]|uniref:hypothetical protein n=1 Tax=Mycobacterium sp. pV006 TaxID=3238983 RepID=UPI00351BE724